METPGLPEICTHCQSLVPANAIFCPNCGKALKEVVQKMTLWKQLSVYALSFFFPPFGLIPAIKYIRESDESTKRVGYLCIFLTTLSVVISLFMVAQIFSAFSALDLANPYGL